MNADHHDSEAERLAERVGARAARKLKGRRHPAPGLWFGLGMMGLVGWSVVLPTLAGAALGLWLDRHYPGPLRWTLALLMAGLTLGCAYAWRWVRQEQHDIEEEENDDHP